MKKFLTLLFTVAAVLSLAVCFAACDTDKPEDNTGKYALSYAKGAYAAQGDIPETKYYNEGDEVTLAPATTFTFSGYTFSGWSDGTDLYEGGVTFTMPANDVKLMAKWTEGDPNAGSITSSSVGFDGGYFVFTGSVKNVENLYVYLNNTNVSASNDNYVKAEITGSNFTARLPLSTLIGYSQSNVPFNLRYKIDSLSAEALGVEQGSLNLSATCNYDEYAFRLSVNSGSGCVAVYYAPAPDTSVKVTPAAVSFDEEYFVVTGAIENVNALYIYLINTNVSASIDNFVEAEITGNTFTAKLPLSDLIAFNVAGNIPFNLRYRANDSKVNVNIAQGDLDITQTHTYDGRAFKLGINNGCIAVYYEAIPDTSVTFAATSISFDEGYFVVSGTVANVNDLYIYLINTNVSATLENFVKAEITDGVFTARLPLSTLIDCNVASTIPFNLRYRVNDSAAVVNIGQGELDITQTHTYGGKLFRLGVNGASVAIYYTDAPVEPEPGEPDYTFSVANMYFTDGKFIVEGTCGADVEKLVFHLNNTESPVIDFTSAAVIADGKFKAEFVLAEIKRVDGSEPPASYINVRYELNDDGFKGLNLLPSVNGDYIVGQEYRYGDRTWTLKSDTAKTFIGWSAITEKYRITEVKLELVEGKPYLKISGTTTDAIEAAQLSLLLDKTTGTKEQKYIENEQTEAGTFSFTVELSDMIASQNATAASSQQAYFIRLYNGETKLADINSRWASDLLWERGQIETENAVYFLMKNTEWSNTAWNTLGICKFDK